MVVLTPEQRLTGLLLDDAPEDTGYNLTARRMAANNLYADMVCALPNGLTARCPSDHGFNPGFLIDVSRETRLHAEFGVTQLSLVVASDRMANRIGDGVNATQRGTPKCFEIALKGGDDNLTYDHPMTGGDAIASFHVERAAKALEWLHELVEYGIEAEATVHESFFPLTHPLQRDDVVCLFGLSNRTDLNLRLGRALGRTNPKTDREGIEMLVGMERIWVRRVNLELVPNKEALGPLRERHPSLPEDDFNDAQLFFCVEQSRVASVPGGGLYSLRG